MIDDPEARARVGRVLNEKWTLEALLGVGGMGAVYRARHRNGARAAIKVLHADLARQPDVRERFLREGKAANKVEHADVVKVIDDDVVRGGPDDGLAYLVMELLDGGSLEDRLERGPKVSERELLGILDAVLDVLAAAHERGVVHRDLKPENLFLAREESGASRVKVLDFGLARLRDAASSTRYGVALGTPSYMSPEQAAGRHDEVDGRSDLFSLAASAFRIITGRKVHDADGPVEQVLKMASMPAPRVHDVAPGVSQPLARVIDRALEFKRDKRFADARAMQAEVRRSIAELGPAVAVPDEFAATVIGPPPLSARATVPAEGETVELSGRDLQPVARAEAAALRATAAAPSTELSGRDLQPVSSVDAPYAAPLGSPREDTGPTAIELSGKDLVALVPAPPEPPPARPPLPSKLTPPRGVASEPSVPQPPMRRVSLVPVVTALLLGGIAVKLALDARDGDAIAAVDAGAVVDDGSAPSAVERSAAPDGGAALVSSLADAGPRDATTDGPDADAAIDAPDDASSDDDADLEDLEEDEPDDASVAPASPGPLLHPAPSASAPAHPRPKPPPRKRRVHPKHAPKR